MGEPTDQSVGDTPQEWQKPTPWYRSKAGEIVLSVAGLVVAIVAYATNELMSIPYPLSELVALVGIIGLVAMFVLSGRAAMKGVEEMMEQ